MTLKEKKLINLGKQVIAAATATEPDVEARQLRATKIHLVACINHNDANIFCQQVHSKTLDLQSRGSDEVEIQYSTSSIASTAGLIITHSALLIGRKYENSKIR